MTTFTPISPDGLVELCVEAIQQFPDAVVVAVDGADAARPDLLAHRIGDRLRTLGRATGVVEMAHYLRPASLRFEYGHTDGESYRTSWFDHAALRREVLDPVRAGEPWLPRLWNPVTDRSFRDDRVAAADDQVIVVAGPMLLGHHDADVTIRLSQSAATLSRHTSPEERWTIPVLLEAAGETRADIEVRYDHPDRPAVATGRS